MKRSARARMLAPTLAALAAAELAVRLLAPRQAPPEPVPVDLETYFSRAEIQRGRSYARPQRALGIAQGALQTLILAAFARRPPERLKRIANPAAGGAVAGVGLSLALTLPTLPLDALGRRRAVDVGLVTQSWRGWAGDQAKSTVIETGFAAVAGAAVTLVTRRYPRGWWAPVAVGSVVFGAALTALAPVILAPIFNDFTPLPEGQTREDVLALARAAGVSVREVYSIDASRRTTAANAYVTGLGPTKRVVLFDTLLDRYSRDEIRIVVAHELAHVRGHDVPRGVAYTALIAPGAALAAQRLSWSISPARGTPAALPALALAAGTVSAPVGVVANRLSRAVERRADAVSLELTGASDAFVSFERAIALQNVVDLDPPRWVTALLATHPSTAQRIGAALSYASQAGR